MNERIKELAMQSGFRNYNGPHLFSPYIEGMELDDELEEFAKLIIHECLSIVDDETKSHWDTRVEIFNDIVKHFGVK